MGQSLSNKRVRAGTFPPRWRRPWSLQPGTSLTSTSSPNSGAIHGRRNAAKFCNFFAVGPTPFSHRANTAGARNRIFLEDFRQSDTLPTPSQFCKISFES